MSIRQKSIGGVKWTTISSASLAITNLVKISILARLLDKSDFGLMALVTFVLGFMNLFMDMGLSSAILHRQKISREEYSSLFWINVFSSLLLFTLISITSPWFAKFYKEPQLSVLIPLMSVSIILAALGRQFKTVEQKELNFRYLAFTDIAGSIIGVLTGVYMAFKGFGVYALVLSTLVHYAVSNCILLQKGARKDGIRFHYRFEEAKPFLRMGMFQVGGQVINYFNRDLDVLLIGKIMGTEVLGGYSLAKQFVRRPMQILNPIITRVASSVFPRYQNENEKLCKYFAELLKSLSSLYAFIYGAIAILAPILVKIFFGMELISISIYVQLFCVVQFFRSIGNMVGIVVVTKGKTEYDLYWNVLITLIMPLAVIIGAQVSIGMIIIMLSIVQLIMLIPGWWVFYYKLIGLNLRQYLEATLLPFIIAVIFVVLNIIFSSDITAINFFFCILLFSFLVLYSYKRIEEFKKLLIWVQLKVVNRNRKAEHN